MKKRIGILLIVIASLCLVVAVILSDDTKSRIQEQTLKNISLISELKTEQYVSLPVLEGMVILEDTVKHTDMSETEAYEILFQSAKRIDMVDDDCTVIANCTLSKNGLFVERFTGYPIGIRKQRVSEEISEALSGKGTGSTVKVEDISFEGHTGIDLSISITEILDMPYPVSDSYMKEHTEYSSLEDMKRRRENRVNQESIHYTRQNTMSLLLAEVISNTTFMEIPQILLEQEFQVQRVENPDALYSEAREHLKKLLVIHAILEKYDFLSETDAQNRYRTYIEKYGNTDDLSEYEKERLVLLLYEEDVVNLIYKKVEIQEM